MSLKSFGTDGEVQLIKAFEVVFPHAVHLRCVNHLRQNVEDKLYALTMPQIIWKEFLGDIFGQQVGAHYEKGLVDCESPETFRAAVAKVERRWNDIESGIIGEEGHPQFHSWLVEYKADVIIKCVLPEIRRLAGWTSDKKFTTNSSESLNHVIKQEVEWKESKLPVLVNHLQAIVTQQGNELESAVIGRGEWKFTGP